MLCTGNFCFALVTFALHRKLLLCIGNFCFAPETFAYYQKLLPSTGNFCLVPVTFAYYQKLLLITRNFCLVPVTFALYRKLLLCIGNFCQRQTIGILGCATKTFVLHRKFFLFSWMVIRVALLISEKIANVQIPFKFYTHYTA